ncbi:MAG: OsmC family protein [Chitinispirillaceae bacterium]|nr:OsmC family protein [Chitinispirillaceae bacterium]
MEMIVTFPGGKRVDAHYKGFTIRTDQSVANNGEASAPAPFDLFLASIATCAGIYVLDFCQHRSISTEQIRLIQKIKSNSETNMIEAIAIEISVPPEFPAKYKDAVVRAAQLCSVKKHLFQPPEFSVFLKIKEAERAEMA